MKMNKYFMLGLAGLAFAACSNEEDAIVGGGTDNKTMVVSIAGIGADTKASTPGDKWSSDNAAVDNISSLTLFFTDANGVIKYKYDADETDKEDEWNGLFGTGLKFVGLSGVTAVHAIANDAAAASLAVNGNINTLKTAYADQGLSIAKTGVVYVGSDKDITPFNPEPAKPETMPEVTVGEEGNFYYSAEVKLKPIISRIQINSITVETSGSTTFGPTEDADKYTLTWNNFKPVLNGIYLNNIATEFTDFAGTVNALSKNTTYLQTIADGAWTLGGSDMAANAAYVSFASSNYGELLAYGTEDSDGKTPLTIADGKCIAFNVFVPLDVEDADVDMDKWASTNNPTIHFQFAKNVTGYDASDYSLTDDPDGTLTPEDNAFIATAEKNLAYQLPQVADGGYLFANITELHETSVNGALLQMQAGKIYNMDVEISPVNMTIDLDNPQSYNVVVKVTVLPFTEANIYPSLGE